MRNLSRSSSLVGMAIILLATTLVAQPDTLWTRTYGATFKEIWTAKTSVIETSDGGYIAVADTNSSEGADLDYYVVKTGPNGDIQWTRNYGGQYRQVGYSIDETFDGGYIVTGWVGEASLGLLRLDARGDSLWAKEYGDDNQSMFGYSVQQTSDSGFIVTGWIERYDLDDWRDVLLMKLDNNGDSLWTKRFGGEWNDIGFCVRQTSDGGYIVSGWNGHTNESTISVYLIKTDENGDSVWSKTYSEIEARAHGVDQTTDGGYIITGLKYLGEYNYDAYLMKTDENGDILWTRIYGGDGFVGYGVQQTLDGGYIVAGMTESVGAGNMDVYVIRTDANGDSLWATTYGGEYGDLGYSIQQTSDGGFIIAGLSYSFAPFSPDGYQIYLIKTAPDEGITEQITPQHPSPVLEANPNPFEKKTTIRYHLPVSANVNISIYDPLGRKVSTLVDGRQPVGTHTLTWDGSDEAGERLSAGVYFMRLEAGVLSRTARLVIIR